MIQHILYIITQAPYSTAAGQEALDSILVGATFEQRLSVLFLDDGVFQLKPPHDTANTLLKAYNKAFKALPDFDVENIYLHDLSMMARGLQPSDLMLSATMLNNNDISALIARQSRVFTFS